MGKTYHDNPRLLEELLNRDFIRKLEPLFELGWYIRPDDGKLALRPGAHGIEHSSNWIHPNPDPDRPCQFYQLIFQHCNFIPKRCLSCWKVVVRPTTLKQLLQLHDLQVQLAEQNPKCWSKCGWESRHWVHGNYGGYFYCNSKEVGLERLVTVRQAVDDYINPAVDVLLKRYCTEFELRFGDSSKYERPPVADVMETAIFEGTEVERLSEPQPQSVKDHIMAEWILKAYSIGDPTAIFYNQGKLFYTPPRRYFKEVFKNGEAI